MLGSDEVCNLFSSDDLNVPKEETVYYAMLAWANYDTGSRQSEISKLLEHIRLPLLSPQVRSIYLSVF